MEKGASGMMMVEFGPDYYQAMQRIAELEAEVEKFKYSTAENYRIKEVYRLENERLRQIIDDDKTDIPAMYEEITKLREGLRRLEWSGRTPSQLGLISCCPVCSGLGSHEYCWLAKLLEGKE